MPSTKDYSKFILLEYNREKINKKHVGKIKTSIVQNGYLASNPVIVNKKMEILDGQHRFTACKELGYPVLYKVVDDSRDNSDLIITLNNTQKKWTMNDYINYYAGKYGKDDYLRLQALCKGSNIAPTIALAIAGIKKSGAVSNKVARGDLQFSLEDELKVVNFYDRARLVCDALRQKMSSRYIDGLLAISQKEGFEWSTMIHKAKTYPTKAYNCITKEDYIIMLRDLYNYKSKTDKIQ